MSSIRLSQRLLFSTSLVHPSGSRSYWKSQASLSLPNFLCHVNCAWVSKTWKTKDYVWQVGNSKLHYSWIIRTSLSFQNFPLLDKSNSKLSYFIMQFSMFKQHRYVIWDQVTFRVKTLIIIMASENWLAKIMYQYYAIWRRIWPIMYVCLTLKPLIMYLLHHWKYQIKYSFSLHSF